jgi:hypothetical protein
MNALEQFHITLDDSFWDVTNENEINSYLQEVNGKLGEKKLYEAQHFAEIDRQAFHFSKTPDQKLSFRASGIQKSEDGSEISFEWPDIRSFKKEDFDYLYDRFRKCKNLFARTEYGLILFYSKNKQDNGFVIKLLNSLSDLLKTYIEKAKNDNGKNLYVKYAKIVLANALHIGNNRKGDIKIRALFTELIEYTFYIHQNWDIKNAYTLNVLIDLTDFAVQYFNEFDQIVETRKIIDKNWVIAKSLTNTNIWGAIYIADISISLQRKLKADIKEWLQFKAEKYELQSKERKDDISSLSFIENAISIYKSIKDKNNLSRLEKEYQQKRTEFNLGKIKQELPQDETQRILRLIKKRT